jgi:hypothetical protein
MPPLAREISIALAVKALMLILLYVAFFGPSHRVAVTPPGMAAALFESGSVPQP